MVTLELVDGGWVGGPDDDPVDQCAHGRVRLEAASVEFVCPEDGEWTVSAAGLFLLRALEEDHTRTSSVTDGNLLFPCCGNGVFPTPESRYGLVCIGCPSGLHIDVVHAGDAVLLTGAAGTASVTRIEWRRAVVGFCEQVQALYDNASSKDPLQAEDEKGWALFWTEWRERLARARAGSAGN